VLGRCTSSEGKSCVANATREDLGISIQAKQSHADSFALRCTVFYIVVVGSAALSYFIFDKEELANSRVLWWPVGKLDQSILLLILQMMMMHAFYSVLLVRIQSLVGSHFRVCFYNDDTM